MNYQPVARSSKNHPFSLAFETRPAGGERDARELTLQIALGASLIPARGYAHNETEVAY